MALLASAAYSIALLLSSFLWRLQHATDFRATYTNRIQGFEAHDNNLRASSDGNIKLDGKECLGAPYLYITLHQGNGNVLKYSRNGCLLDDAVLVDTYEVLHYDTQLRSMMIGDLGQKSGILYVADGSNHNSQIIYFDNCESDPHSKYFGKRKYLGKVVDNFNNPGASHAYGLATDHHGNIYASFQHTGAVLRFHESSFRPMDLPPAFYLSRREDYFEGTFMQFGSPREHRIHSDEGVRAVLGVRTNILIANEDLNGVAVVSSETGLISEIIPVEKPIGLFYDEHTDVVYIGSKSKKFSGAVYALDGLNLQILGIFAVEGMDHPAGIAVHGDVLFVCDQTQNIVVAFDTRTQEYLGIVVKDFPDKVEQIILSNC